MRIAAIIPVKTFSKAKTRLDLPVETKKNLCKIMFEEVLQTISISSKIDEIIVVSKDEEALSISKKFKATTIIDRSEIGVNSAVSLADKYLEENNFDVSIVFPQDIPFMKTQDIDFLLNFQNPPKFLLVVPSRHFDGTNALVRMPVNLIKTHYDEDSYKIHLEKGKLITKNSSLVFVRRIMLDIDNFNDLRLLIQQKEKPTLCKKLGKLASN